jgi:hypothetical protein
MKEKEKKYGTNQESDRRKKRREEMKITRKEKK